MLSSRPHVPGIAGSRDSTRECHFMAGRSSPAKPRPEPPHINTNKDAVNRCSNYLSIHILIVEPRGLFTHKPNFRDTQWIITSTSTGIWPAAEQRSGWWGYPSAKRCLSVTFLCLDCVWLCGYLRIYMWVPKDFAPATWKFIFMYTCMYVCIYVWLRCWHRIFHMLMNKVCYTLTYLFVSLQKNMKY